MSNNSTNPGQFSDLEAQARVRFAAFEELRGFL